MRPLRCSKDSELPTHPLPSSHTHQIFNICIAIPPKSFKLKEDVFLALNYWRNFWSRVQLPLSWLGHHCNKTLLFFQVLEDCDWSALPSASCLEMAPQTVSGCWHLTGSREGNSNPLQCSCLENPRDRGAWWAAVYGVAQSRTRLKWLSSSSSSVW